MTKQCRKADLVIEAAYLGYLKRVFEHLFINASNQESISMLKNCIISESSLMMVMQNILELYVWSYLPS